MGPISHCASLRGYSVDIVLIFVGRGPPPLRRSGSNTPCRARDFPPPVRPTHDQDADERLYDGGAGSSAASPRFSTSRGLREVAIHAEVHACREPGCPDAYVAALTGWRRDRVEGLRAAMCAAADFQEVIKWGHLVYFATGPVLLIRAEEARVLLGFWRGQRLRSVEPRLKPGGKYEMATFEISAETAVDLDTVRRLAKEAVALNARLGDPTGTATRT